MYNYLEAMKEDVLTAIENDYNPADYDNRDDFEQMLNDELWTDDGVTGNASGSYTFSRATAQEYVIDDGMQYIDDMRADFGLDDETIADHFVNEDWEYFDVSIRCYLLGQAIAAALDELDYDFDANAEDDAEDDAENESESSTPAA